MTSTRMTPGDAEVNLMGATNLLHLMKSYGWNTEKQEQVVALCREELQRVEEGWA